MSARFWVAQYVRDVLRNEPQNVGVFVAKENETRTRFFGEIEGRDDFDGRRLSKFNHPGVYRQWVNFWRTKAGAGQFDEILKANGANFRVFFGGTVQDIGADTTDDVLNYVYSTFVGGGLREALGLEDGEQPIRLKYEVNEALIARNLLDTEGLAHPVVRERVVRGAVAEHKPAFSQQNGLLYVMETVDFTTNRKRGAQEHAGFSAYMFQDIKAAYEGSQAIALFKAAASDLRESEVRSGLNMLEEEATALVDWQNAAQRNNFLEARREAAIAI